MSEREMEDLAIANAQPGGNYHLVGLTAQNGTSTLYYIPVDATLALDQSISPQWSSDHTFYQHINLGATNPASLLQEGTSLKYTVPAGQTHAFYVGNQAVAQIDDPSSPAGDTSLVSKAYLDHHSSSNGAQPGVPARPAVSLGGRVTDGTQTTYMRSDAVLQLDQGISPQWSATHAFLSNVTFGAAGSSSLGQSGTSLKYTVAAGQTHAFYVGATIVGQIDNPSSPAGGTSLVSKAYLDAHSASNSVQPGVPKRPAVSLGAPVSDGTETTYMRSDAVLQLDQGISPRWSATHAFLSNVTFGTAGSSSLGQSGTSLKYTVAAGQTHAFYVGATIVGQIDNPSSPAGGTSLVSKAYLDAHSASNSVQPGVPKRPAVSLGAPVTDGTETTYMRSDAVLQLDQGISPRWSATHAFLSNVTFGTAGSSSLGQSGTSLKYTVAAGQTHAFCVGANIVGQIDNPASPTSSTSLVSKAYVDARTVLPGKPQSPAVSIGSGVKDGTAATYLRSDAVLELDQGISPQWSAPHTFLGNVNFGKTNVASLGQAGASLNYTVSSSSGVHAFYVGNTLVGTVDNPLMPKSASSLVSKGYVDQVFPATLQKYIAISNILVGPNDNPATVGSSRGSLAIGRSAKASSDGGIAFGEAASVGPAAGGVAIGYSAISGGTDSIALGKLSSDDGLPNVLSIGNGQAGGKLRRIIHMADGQADTDAATVGQLKQLSTSSSPSPYVAFSTTNYEGTGPAAAKGNDSMAIGMQASATGSYNLALGKETAVDGTESVAIGYKTFSRGSQSVSLGFASGDQGQARVVSVGRSDGGSPGVQRRIINVDDAKASNEAATFGQLQSSTSPRFSGYFDGGVANLPDGVQEGSIYALRNWPVCSAGIFEQGQDTRSVARLVDHAATASVLTFYVCLNRVPIGTIVFHSGQQAGTITFDKNPKETDGAWLLQVGDLVSLTAPHPSAANIEQASGLVVVLVSSVRWTCTPDAS